MLAHLKKKEHKTAQIPALQKLTHIGHAGSFGSLLVGWLVGADTFILNYENQDVTSMQWLWPTYVAVMFTNAEVPAFSAVMLSSKYQGENKERPGAPVSNQQ